MNDTKPVTAMSIKMIAKITSYDEGRLCGVLDSLYFKEPHEFSDVTGMIEIMDTTFDAIGFPDKALLPRSFGKAKARMRRLETDVASLRESLAKLLGAKRSGGNGAQGESGCLATFEIFVSFRHKAEWQGKVCHVDSGETKPFSSIVELMRLIDEAVGQ